MPDSPKSLNSTSPSSRRTALPSRSSTAAHRQRTPFSPRMPAPSVLTGSSPGRSAVTVCPSAPARSYPVNLLAACPPQVRISRSPRILRPSCARTVNPFLPCSTCSAQNPTTSSTPRCAAVSRSVSSTEDAASDAGYTRPSPS